MILEDKGQISGEYLLLTGSLIIIIIMTLSFISYQEEMNLAMVSARNGVSEGGLSFQIYPEESYKDYSNSKEGLLSPYSVDIVNVSYSEVGFDNVYKKEKIQFKVYAKCSKDLDKKELDSIGDRINYNLRKSIAGSFNTTQATNKLYNPVFSPHYVYTTANVKWI